MSAAPLRFFVYSDYLCPWCRNLEPRLHRLQQEYGDRIEFAWKSYLLRPEKKEGRDLQKFRHYTKNWLRIGAEDGAAKFVLWASDEGPPSHSIPPHVVAKAARAISREAFERVHEGLMQAYFEQSRDITSDANLRAIWAEAGLPADGFDASRDPAFEAQVIAEHREALDLGATGVPAVQLEGNPAVIVGCHPVELYQRWIEKTLARLEPQAG